MRKSANNRSRLPSRPRSTRSRTADRASDGVMTSPFQHAAKRATHDGLANGSASFAAGASGELRRNLGGDAGDNGARHIAGDLLRGRQGRAARSANAEDIAKPFAHPMKDT